MVGSSCASASEPITIREIVDEPKSFHLKQVTLRGTVRNVTPLDPYKLPAGTMCYGAYLFYLEDETSSINVAVYGRCGVPTVKIPMSAGVDSLNVASSAAVAFYATRP